MSERLPFELPDERVLAIFNPAATNSERARYELDHMRELYGNKYVELRTSPHGHEANVALVLTNARAGDWIVTASGDGMLNAIACGLRHPEAASSVNENPLYAKDSGNAADFSHVFVSPWRYRNHPDRVLRSRNIVPFYPLEVSLTLPDRPTRHFIDLAYESFGITGNVAHRLNQREPRDDWLDKLPAWLGRKIREGISGSQGIRARQPFKIAYANGTTDEITDMIYSRIPRMAKGLIRPRIDPRDEAFAEARVRAKRLAALAPTVGALSLRLYPWEQIKEMEFILQDNVWRQGDGEDELLPSGTKVQLRLATQALNVFTTKRKYLRAARASLL